MEQLSGEWRLRADGPQFYLTTSGKEKFTEPPKIPLIAVPFLALILIFPNLYNSLTVDEPAQRNEEIK